MNGRFEVTVTDYARAQETARHVQLGTWFVFAEDVQSSSWGRLGRLLAKPPRRRSVLCLAGGPVALPGVTVVPKDRGIQRIAALVADRDLYRAEQDTAYLFAALPGKAGHVTLVVEMNGALFTERKLELGAGGMAVEPLSMLLAGSYTARLREGGRDLGQPVSFTVAEYTLAPLSARLVSHRLDRGADALQFELAVESYQVPFDRELQIALVEGGREVARVRVAPSAPGRYAGRVPVGGGEGPLRLRLSAADDAARVAEVAIPGSRKAERQTTVVSELGQEVLLSLMPDAGALPMRGGYLSSGDYLSTPLIVEKVDAVPGVIRAQAALESLVLAVLDLTTGSFRVVEHGDVAAGTELRVECESPVFSVFAGCWVGGAPFEGYTSFFRPVQASLGLSVPEVAAPRSELPIKITCRGTAGPASVLLCVKDQRLTAADTPESALAGSVKRGIDAAVEGMKDSALEPLANLVRPPPMAYRTRLTSLARSAGLPAAAAPGGTSAGTYCPNGHVMHPSWEVCPYCTEMQQMVMTGGSGLMVEEAEDQRPSGAPLARHEAPPQPARADFPEVLFYGIVRVAGEETVTIPLADSLGTFAVEAFTLAGGDWTQARGSFAVDKPVRVDLDLPPAVHPEDKVTGRLRAAAKSGRLQISLTRDGVPVALPAAELASPAELEFALAPGRYRASVTDAATGETDVAEVEVGTPGKFRSLVREMALLQPGDSMTLDSAGALSLRVLPGLEAKMKVLVEATADYGHLCCEQTAAKMLAATVMWLSAEGPAQRTKAESVILAGIAREKRMWRKGKGFSMYPEQSGVHEHYSPLVVRYLWSLDGLSRAPGVPESLREALAEGLAMADDAARPFRLARVPERIASVEDAWAVAQAGSAGRAVDYVETAIDFAGPQPKARGQIDKVSERALLAYGSAVLLAAGRLERGVRAANQVTRQLNEEGRLYSTVDSVAAIAMMSALMRAGVIGGTGRVRVNGAEMDSADAARLADQVETIEVLSGCVPVEVARIHEEDWSRFHADLPVKVGFHDEEGSKINRFRMGDRVDLKVELPKGYRAGDLVHVALPACMSWIKGGGRVKRFSLDFEGKSGLSVPLVVTGKIEGKQRFAVCVRNMFEEERAASPGLLAIG